MTKVSKITSLADQNPFHIDDTQPNSHLFDCLFQLNGVDFDTEQLIGEVLIKPEEVSVQYIFSLGFFSEYAGSDDPTSQGLYRSTTFFNFYAYTDDYDDCGGDR